MPWSSILSAAGTFPDALVPTIASALLPVSQMMQIRPFRQECHLPTRPSIVPSLLGISWTTGGIQNPESTHQHLSTILPEGKVKNCSLAKQEVPLGTFYTVRYNLYLFSTGQYYIQPGQEKARKKSLSWSVVGKGRSEPILTTSHCWPVLFLLFTILQSCRSEESSKIKCHRI